MAPTLEYISPSLPGEALLFVSWIPCAIRDSIIDRTAFLVVDRSSRRPLDPTAPYGSGNVATSSERNSLRLENSLFLCDGDTRFLRCREFKLNVLN